MRRIRISFAPLLGDIPAPDQGVAQLLEGIGVMLEQRGGRVTDVGYDAPGARCELVIMAADGQTRIELTARRIVLPPGLAAQKARESAPPPGRFGGQQRDIHP